MISLGPHAAFILSAYAAAIVIVAALLIWVVSDYRAQRRVLADLEQRGVGRRASRQRESA